MEHKTTNLIHQVLGFQFLREGCQNLQGNTISLITDEKKINFSQLAILGTYFATESYQMHSILIDMNGKLLAEIKLQFKFQNFKEISKEISNDL